MKKNLGVWRRFTAMMAATRSLAHVRFRCCYTVFQRWRREARRSRIYCTRGVRSEVQCRRDLLRRFSDWLRDAPFDAHQFGRYSVLARWIEYSQRRVVRRELCRLQTSVQLLRRRRKAFLALFLGLKPQHQGSSSGYVEKNMTADAQLWKFMLRAEIGLLSDKHRAVNRRELQNMRTSGLQTMTVRRRFQIVQEHIELRVQNEQAVLLEVFKDRTAWIPVWGAIFQARTSALMKCLKAMQEWAKRVERLLYTPAASYLAAVCCDHVRAPLGMWVLRARLRIRHLEDSAEQQQQISPQLIQVVDHLAMKCLEAV